MNKSVPVQINLVTTMRQGTQRDSSIIAEDGFLVKCLDTQYCLYYLEHQGDTSIPVQFSLIDDCIRLTRGRKVKNQLIFKKRAETKSNYRTTYGMIPLVVKTNEFFVDVDWPIRGEIRLSYQLIGNDKSIGSYRVKLLFKV